MFARSKCQRHLIVKPTLETIIQDFEFSKLTTQQLRVWVSRQGIKIGLKKLEHSNNIIIFKVAATLPIKGKTI